MMDSISIPSISPHSSAYPPSWRPYKCLDPPPTEGTVHPATDRPLEDSGPQFPVLTEGHHRASPGGPDHGGGGWSQASQGQGYQGCLHVKVKEGSNRKKPQMK